MGIKKGGSMVGNIIEKSQVDLIATFVVQVMKEYRKDSEPKVKSGRNLGGTEYCFVHLKLNNLVS